MSRALTAAAALAALATEPRPPRIDAVAAQPRRAAQRTSPAWPGRLRLGGHLRSECLAAD
jgi:hypothetical protein